jgi:hypothetical protein
MAVMMPHTLSRAVTLESFAAARNVIEMGLSSDIGEIGTTSPRTLKPGSPGFGSGLTFKPVGTPIVLGPETFCNLLLCRLPRFESVLLILQIVKVILESFRNLVVTCVSKARVLMVEEAVIVRSTRCVPGELKRS